MQLAPPIRDRARQLRQRRLPAIIAMISGATLLVAALATTGAFSRPGLATAGPANALAASVVVPPAVAPAPTATATSVPGPPNAAQRRGDVAGVGVAGSAVKLPVKAAAGTPKSPARYGRFALLLPLPSHSGTGKRIVFSLGHQQVWLVSSAGKVERTYRVSGSKFDQVKVKRYAVTGRYRHTTSYLGDATMEFMVTFTHGKNAVIGFHAIPISIKSHQPEQMVAQLGRRLSAGCVRQYRADAVALWKFAPVGTPVYAVA